MAVVKKSDVMEAAADEFVPAPDFEFSTDEEEFTVPVDPDIEYESAEEFQRSPEFVEAVRKGQLGQFDHTMFEAWENVIQGFISVCERGITMPLADGLLRQWSFLRFSDIEGYLVSRQRKLEEALETLRRCYPKPAEDLFKENVEDFRLHKDAYIDVAVAWTRMSNRWVAVWDAIPLKNHGQKAVQMAVVSDLTALFINPERGLVENLRNLADFHDIMTEEDAAKMLDRINAPEDETD